MKFDLEISCDATDVAIEHFKNKLVNAKFVKRPNSELIFIRTDCSEVENQILGEAITNYLKEFRKNVVIFSKLKSTLRIGVFFNVNEIAFLNIALSKAQIQELSDFNLALDISCYPCSE